MNKVNNFKKGELVHFRPPPRATFLYPYVWGQMCIVLRVFPKGGVTIYLLQDQAEITISHTRLKRVFK